MDDCMIPSTLKQILQLNDIAILAANCPKYNEFRQWQLALRNNAPYAISESTINAVYECEKSAFSILIEQAVFLTDEQKIQIKGLYAQECATCLDQVKCELRSNGLLLNA